jgi:hypothetical protein
MYNNVNSVRKSNFNSSNPTRFLIHGYLQGADASINLPTARYAYSVFKWKTFNGGSQRDILKYFELCLRSFTKDLPFFAKLIFFPAKTFFGILKREICLSKKNLAGKKLT